jgi:hypothetical protein
MIAWFSPLIFRADIPEEGLQRGDVGTIVQVYGQDEAFEVEFFTLDGSTAALATVLASQARPVTGNDLTHARHVKIVP